MKKNTMALLLMIIISCSSLFAQLPVMVAEICPGSESVASPKNFCIYNNNLYFGAYDGTNTGLWVTDGTEANTNLITLDFTSGTSYLTVVNNVMIYYCYDDTHGYELWVSDGTTIGTHLLKDINPGSGDSFPFLFTMMGNKVYFTAQSSFNNYELWVTDGTSINTVMVKDINPEGSSEPSGYTLYNNKLYFAASTETEGEELWVTDGTTAGTFMVKDINPGTGGSQPSYMAVYNNKLYFSAYEGTNGVELWATDGTLAGTNMVKDINPGTGFSRPELLTVCSIGMGNTKLFFRAWDGTHGYELWKSDGTESGTTMVKDIQSGSESAIGYSGYTYFQPYYFKFYFSADDGINGNELWVSDGTEVGTTMLKDINPGTSGSSPSGFVTYHGKTYFRADDGTGNHLWRTNGTPEGTEKVAPDIVTSANPLLNFYGFFVYNYALYYGANYNSDGNELWKLDIPYVISTSSLPVAGGSTSGGGDFHPGDEVSVTATPNPGYNFVNWTEGVEVSTSETYTFTVAALPYSRSLVANFELISGVNENQIVQTTIYPNPASDFITLTSSNQEITAYNILDVSGRLIIEAQQNYKINEPIKIDVSTLSKGAYFIDIITENNRVTKKFAIY